VSDLRYRYAGSALGVFSNLLMPVTMLAVYVVIFTRLLGPRSAAGGGAAGFYPFYPTCGFLPWITFAEAPVRSS
jgi:ABC-type polysaccharide/polyol phosphate export permease